MSNVVDFTKAKDKFEFGKSYEQLMSSYDKVVSEGFSITLEDTWVSDPMVSEDNRWVAHVSYLFEDDSIIEPVADLFGYGSHPLQAMVRAVININEFLIKSEG